MGSIEADVEGLAALGGLCQAAADGLGSGSGSPAPQHSPAFQPTTRAVDDVLTMAGGAENLIGVRLRVTGHAIVIAADRLANCEDTSRARIAGIHPGSRVL